MADWEQIYEHRAEDYERLIAREDFEGRLLHAIEEIAPLSPTMEVVDSGAGTGRLAYLLAPKVHHVYAYDLYPAMLEVAKQKLSRLEKKNFSLEAADHRKIPRETASCDLVISGWSVAYLMQTKEGDWKEEVKKALAEFQRLLRPGGKMIIIETLGTGYENPHRLDVLVPYFDLLESLGFSHKSIRTDYKFESLNEAEELARFFFGNELAEKVVKNKWDILPECTGLWWL